MTLSIQEKYSSIKERIGFNLIRAHLKKTLQITAQSSRELIERLDGVADKKLVNISLDEIAKDSIIGGKRQYEIFKVENKSSQEHINKYFKEVNITGSGKIGSYYPYAVTDQSLLESVGSPLAIVDSYNANWQSDRVDVAVFTQVSKRQVTESATKFLNKEGFSMYSSGAQFTMRSEKFIHQYHLVIWCRVKKLLLISVDRNYEISQTDSRDCLRIFKNNLSTIMKSGLGNSVNLFDSIEHLYAENAGSITRLGLLTTDNNPVRLSLSKGESCIKTDKYHKLGEDGGYVHGKFLVAKEWVRGRDKENQMKVSIELPGVPAMLDTSQELIDFSVTSCSKLDDVHFILKKLNILS